MEAAQKVKGDTLTLHTPQEILLQKHYQNFGDV